MSVTFFRTLMRHPARTPTQCLRVINSRGICTTDICGESSKVNLFELNFDRRIKVDYRDSIKYMKSDAYNETYQGHLVWEQYKRNHKSFRPREETRPTCVNDEGFVQTSYPCSICRDEYLVLHPDNYELLKQFINPYTGEIYSRRLHGLCRRQWRNLIIAVHQAKDMGTLPYQVPERYYDFSNYYEKN